MGNGICGRGGRYHKMMRVGLGLLRLEADEQAAGDSLGMGVGVC